MANIPLPLLLLFLALRIQQCVVLAISIDNIGAGIPQGDYIAPPSSSPTSLEERPYSSIDIIMSTPNGPNRGTDGNSDNDGEDCYKVMRNLFFNNEVNHPGCKTDRFEMDYYNGYLDEQYEETGYPKESYLEVTIEIVRDCIISGAEAEDEQEQEQVDDSCTISVKGYGQCNLCSYNSALGTITMEDCSNLKRIFIETDSNGNPQSMAASSGTIVCPTPTTCITIPQFFPLSTVSINGSGGSLQRCNHPLWFGDNTYAPTPIPSHHIKIKLYLTFSFLATKGRQPTPEELVSLQRVTHAFIKHSLNSDPIMFGGGGGGASYLVDDDVILLLLKDRYTTDQIRLEMDLTIVLQEPHDEVQQQQQQRAAASDQDQDQAEAAVVASASRINKLLSSSSLLHRYIVKYVRYLGRVERSIWYYVQNVHYRGVSY